jgi:tRNA(Ile2) C34 agmatinyltransferase TiaS
MPTLQDIFNRSLLALSSPAKQPVGVDASAQESIIENLELEELEWEELDETKYPPCSKCGSHDLWLPVASRGITSEEPAWQCRKCDRKPNTKAQAKLERLKLKWDKV